ncbi:hypothetical protein NKH77_28380 [Streptomyces sp. M19]
MPDGPDAPVGPSVHWLDVPLATRREKVPVVAAEFRARLHLLVERALRHHRPDAGVLSYRSADWVYRSGHRARRDRLRALADRPELPLALRVDVHRFAASLRRGRSSTRAG